jgi:hypothetical protein
MEVKTQAYFHVLKEVQIVTCDARLTGFVLNCRRRAFVAEIEG